MRILLIQAYLGRREPPVAPLGIASLAAQISQHQVIIFDPNISTSPLKETTRLIQDFDPQIIGISLRNIDTTKFSDQFDYFEHFQEFIKLIGKENSNAVITVGGCGFSLFPRQIMKRTPEIDCGFYLEAESSFADFVNRVGDRRNIPGLFFREGNDITFTGCPDKVEIDELIPPAWDLVNLKPYHPFTNKASIGVETKRGCAQKCAYCNYPKLSGSILRMKSPAKVVDEMETLANKGVDRIFFCDAVFNFPLEHAESICRKILRRELKIKWSAYHQDKFLTREYITLARESGCVEFYFSPDSASAEGLKALRKSSTAASLYRSLNIIAEDGKAKASYNFFAAIPGLGWKNFLSAVKFVIRAKSSLGERLLRYKFSYIRLEPGTLIADEVLGSGGADFLLPESSTGLKKLFYRKSASFLLNILLSIHFHLGKWLGKKNIIGL